MPDGVEHAIHQPITAPAAIVILPLMPDGVEHSSSLLAQARRRDRDPSSDARRR